MNYRPDIETDSTTGKHRVTIVEIETDQTFMAGPWCLSIDAAYRAVLRALQNIAGIVQDAADEVCGRAGRP